MHVLFGQVAHEMSMICQCEEIIDQFEEKWKSFVGVIISYSKAIPFQTKELKLILDELGDDYKGMFTGGCACSLMYASDSLHRQSH